ncbi:LysR family transcriptional regulator [Sphingopyxis sp.]|uniref:LysR family transcriptional regulator n=1 Tax=Sphingopyxis sp. TaxID=1908224 RepID=UPI0026354758|nr:LysR family transcriptional regulator [Sphingopyxis sp.]MCW0198199.1 LysR family transcriptional regulator [Sphingopyxis sp.]
MNLRRLRHFDTLYRLGSYARAADELGLTQSALTRSIQKLEGELDATLFDRTTHYVRPTSDADRLIRSARDVIAASANLEQEARGLGQPSSGTVAVGAGPYPLQPLLTDAIARFAERHPGVRVTVTGGPSEQLLETLVDRRLDLVVCNRAKFATSAHADEVLCIPLPPEPLVLVCAPDHPLARGEGDSGDFPWALPRPAPGSNFPRAIRARFAAGRFPDYELDSTAACLDMAKSGRAITVVPRRLALRSGLAMIALPPSEVTRDAIHLLRNRSRSALVAAFVAVLKDAAQADGIASNSAASGDPAR